MSLLMMITCPLLISMLNLTLIFLEYDISAMHEYNLNHNNCYYHDNYDNNDDDDT